MFPGAPLVSWKVVFTKQAQKDSKKLTGAGLREKAEQLLTLVSENPYQAPPPYEKLVAISLALTRGESIFNIAWFIRFMKMRGS
jgi:hypothetical protein